MSLARNHTYLALWDAAGTPLSCESAFEDAGDGSDAKDDDPERQIILYPNSGEGIHFQLDEVFKIFVESEFCPQTLFYKSKPDNYFAPNAQRHCHLASILLPYNGLFGVQGSSPNIGGYRHTQPVGRC